MKNNREIMQCFLCRGMTVEKNLLPKSKNTARLFSCDLNRFGYGGFKFMKKIIFLIAGLIFFGGFALNSAALSINFHKTIEPFFGANHGEAPPVPNHIQPFNTSMDMEEGPVSDEIVRERYQKIKDSEVTKHQGLSISKIRSLFHLTNTNKVAGLDYVSKYDPTEALGFCFGRSMAAHLIASKMGLPENDIRKLFVIGDLRSGYDPEWRFHVTTLVKGDDGDWYAIDPVMYRPLRMDGWLRNLQRIWDRNKKATFYITRPDAIMPDLNFVPDIEKETGENIIELSFDPLKNQGFDKKDIPGNIAKVFELSDEAVYKYFSDATEKENRFDFTQVTVNGASLDYHNYFADLTQNILSSPAEISGYAQASFTYSAPSIEMDMPVRKNLGSMKLHLFK